MLHLYRRHVSRCPKARLIRDWKRCACAMWVGGTLEGRPIRRSMKTKSWERAKELADQMERTGQTEIEAKEVPTIATAVNTYLDECTERGFQPDHDLSSPPHTRAVWSVGNIQRTIR